MSRISQWMSRICQCVTLSARRPMRSRRLATALRSCFQQLRFFRQLPARQTPTYQHPVRQPPVQRGHCHGWATLHLRHSQGAPEFTTSLPGGGTLYTFDVAAGLVVSFPATPPGFNGLTATPAEQAAYGIPPAPPSSEAAAYSAWETRVADWSLNPGGSSGVPLYAYGNRNMVYTHGGTGCGCWSGYGNTPTGWTLAEASYSEPGDTGSCGGGQAGSGLASVASPTIISARRARRKGDRDGPTARCGMRPIRHSRVPRCNSTAPRRHQDRSWLRSHNGPAAGTCSPTMSMPPSMLRMRAAQMPHGRVRTRLLKRSWRTCKARRSRTSAGSR